MRRLIVFLPLIFALGLALRGVAGLAVPVVERHLAHEAAGVAAALGASWAAIEVEGRRLRVTGEAPDAASDDLLGRTLARALPMASVVRAATLEPAAGPRRAPMLVELFREGDTILVTGSFPGPAARADLLIALGAAFPEAQIADLSGIEAGGEPVAWGAAVSVSLAALGEVTNAFIRLEPARASISGIAVSEAERQRLQVGLGAMAGPSLELATALTVPRRPIVPFRIIIAADEDGRPLLQTCAARDGAEARRIEAAVAAAGGKASPGDCQAGVGAPALDWQAAAMAGLDAVAGLPGARMTLSGSLARLEADPVRAGGVGVSQDRFETALATLAARLPAGFALDASLSDGDGSTPPSIAEIGWMMIERDADGVRLAGTVATAEVAAALETMAAGIAGRDGVDVTRLAVAGGVGAPIPDPAIARSAVTALDAMTRVRLTGRAAIGPARVVLRATVLSGPDAVATQRLLADGLAPGVQLSTRLTVDLPAALAERPLPPAACAAALNREVALRPLTFAPGSTELDAAARRTVERLSAVLARCRGAVIEVGGHTDNQGRASMNRRLSRQRAEAVQGALSARADPRRVRLYARGYGEVAPVADNATAEGRALNRRIAFSALEPANAASDTVDGDPVSRIGRE
ncbi:MAG: OmpA family protein [Pseudomonadota bacterium]